jgi:hypothetical protein
MPVAWQENFEDASKTMHNSALVKTQRQSKKDPFKASKKKPSSEQQNNPGNWN